MSQKTKLKESIKVNLDSNTYQIISRKARKKGLSKSAIVRTILKQEVEA